MEGSLNFYITCKRYQRVLYYLNCSVGVLMESIWIWDVFLQEEPADLDNGFA
jgi:hypothetical protein